MIKYELFMNKENTSKLWKFIQQTGDELQGKLPDHPNHPKGRNPYAHVAICIKSKFNASYKDIDEQYRFVINRLLIRLNAFIAKKYSSIDVYYIENSGEYLFPTLHFVTKGNITNKELDAYLDCWTYEIKKLIQ